MLIKRCNKCTIVDRRQTRRIEHNISTVRIGRHVRNVYTRELRLYELVFVGVPQRTRSAGA